MYRTHNNGELRLSDVDKKSNYVVGFKKLDD